MTKQDAITLMNYMHPNFFESEHIRTLPEKWVHDEMILSLDEFDPNRYEKVLDDTISFGYYEGNLEELKKEVVKVIQDWGPYFDGKHRVYCGYVNGVVASFCLVEDMGVHDIGGRKLKIGGPGCVGTLPEYRDKGIGLTMVKQVTQILKDEGYDYSYIHYTGDAAWYAKLGYKTTVRWNRNGVL